MYLKQYFEFKGVKYGIGTIVRVPMTLETRWLSREEIMKEAMFVGGARFVFQTIKGSINLYDDSLNGKYENYIEIINPIYYQEPEPTKQPNVFFRTKSGSWDAHNEVCIGFIWYVVIMLIATIFKDRLGIWILTTIVYFSWKSNK